MVAQVILDHLVWVRALVPEPNGPMVKWLRRCPLKAESGVQFPLGLPLKVKPHSNLFECGFLVYLYAFRRLCFLRIIITIWTGCFLVNTKMFLIRKIILDTARAVYNFYFY